MKKSLAILFSAIMAVFLLAGCGKAYAARPVELPEAMPKKIQHAVPGYIPETSSTSWYDPEHEIVHTLSTFSAEVDNGVMWSRTESATTRGIYNESHSVVESWQADFAGLPAEADGWTVWTDPDGSVYGYTYTETVADGRHSVTETWSVTDLEGYTSSYSEVYVTQQLKGGA